MSSVFVFNIITEQNVLNVYSMFTPIIYSRLSGRETRPQPNHDPPTPTPTSPTHKRPTHGQPDALEAGKCRDAPPPPSKISHILRGE